MCMPKGKLELCQKTPIFSIFISSVATSGVTAFVAFLHLFGSANFSASLCFSGGGGVCACKCVQERPFSFYSS